MPRPPRYLLEDQVVHVLNRGNERRELFHAPRDYDHFVEILAELKRKAGSSVRVYAFCLMPNHFHAVLHAQHASDLGSFMARWLTRYTCWHHAKYQRGGHLFQGRYKAFPVQTDLYLEAVLRYVMLNPVAGNLVHHPQNWRWSNLQRVDLVDRWPIKMPANIWAWLAEGYSEGQGAAIRRSIESSEPLGAAEWCERFRPRVPEDGLNVPF